VAPPVAAEEGLCEVSASVGDGVARQGDECRAGDGCLGVGGGRDIDAERGGCEQSFGNGCGSVDDVQQGVPEVGQQRLGKGQNCTPGELDSVAGTLGNPAIADGKVDGGVGNGRASVVVPWSSFTGETDLDVVED